MNNIYTRDISFLKRTLSVAFKSAEEDRNLALVEKIRELPHVTEIEFKRSLESGTLKHEFGYASVLVDQEHFVEETQRRLAQIEGIRHVDKAWNNYN